MSYGLRLGWHENSEQFRAGATLRTDAGPTSRKWVLSLDHLSETERAELFDIEESLGLSGDLFVSGFPEAEGALERDYSGQVKLVRMSNFSHYRLNKDRVPFEFEEA